jgi:hypothetical protein
MRAGWCERTSISYRFQTELRDILLGISSSLESSSASPKPVFDAVQSSASLNWVYDSGWFALNTKKDKRKSSRKPKHIAQVMADGIEPDLPSNCYIGAAELFVGALIFILPFPGAQVLGITVIGDGGRRVIDGVMQLGDERRANPNFVEPNLGPPFDKPSGSGIGVSAPF